MSLFFLIPMMVGFVTASISRKSADDLAEIVGLASILSLALSLVLAPWQIQLIILLFLSTKASSKIRL